MTRRGERGELALVLHTHMPYVEGFGTWPFGEEWLWEVLATCYLPLLELLGRDAPVTLSLTPVLCDQLDADGVAERFATFLDEVRSETHRRDIEGCRSAGAQQLVPELERSAADYADARERLAALDGDLLTAIAAHGAWTSSATHAILPLLATDPGVRLQVQTGVESHRRRTGAWAGGFWLPECAYAPWLEPLLRDAGVRAVCVDLTDAHGMGAVEQLRPLEGQHGLLLVPLDRAITELAWSDEGYPSHEAYRDYHRHTVHHHRPWANGGGLYDREAARALAREHARDFVARTIARLDAGRAKLGAPGLCVCAIDTELLGHWWFEGIAWLDAVLDEATSQGLELARLDDALARHEPAPAPRDLPVTSWGTPRDLSTWDGPAVADLAFRARDAELRVVAAGHDASVRAARELLAVQASDWAFMASRRLAGDYPRERFAAHAAALDAALSAIDSRDAAESRVRNLAPFCSTAPLLIP